MSAHGKAIFPGDFTANFVEPANEGNVHVAAKPHRDFAKLGDLSGKLAKAIEIRRTPWERGLLLTRYFESEKSMPTLLSDDITFLSTLPTGGRCARTPVLRRRLAGTWLSQLNFDPRSRATF